MFRAILGITFVLVFHIATGQPKYGREWLSPRKPIGLKEVSTIGGVKDSWILDAMDVAVLPNGNVLVSDKLEYCLKEFNPDGRLIASVGKRGGKESEFRGPGSIAVGEDRVFVADFASSRVQVFSSSLKYLFTFFTKGLVFSMKMGHGNTLWIGVYTGDKKKELFKYNSDGKLLSSVWLKNTTGDEFRDIFWLCTCPDSVIAISYVVQNKLELWKENGNFVRDFSVPGVRAQAPYKTVSMSKGLFSSEQLKIPLGDLFVDCAADKYGYIYLLMGEYSDRPFQDLLVIDKMGMPVSRLVLPKVSSKIVIANGYLYAVESQHTMIGVYRVLYDKARKRHGGDK